MSLPVYNFTTAVTTNINICTIFPVGSIVGGLYGASPRIFLPAGQNQDPMLDLVTWIVVAGSTGAGTAVTFQEFGGDGTWRSLVTPGPLSLGNGATLNGYIAGPFHALRLAVSGVVGNGIAFAELKSTVRDK